MATIIVVGALLVGGCAVGERPVLTDEALSDAENAIDRGAAAATIPPATRAIDQGADLPSPDTLGEAPPVLLTASGVMVPVLARSDAGYLVRTPCGNEAEVAWGQPIRSAEVVIDAGHGGDERGAIGPSGESEAELNLDVARRTAALLDGQGISAALTRTGDYRIPISNRAAIADQLSASVFVSIHHNSPTPKPVDDPGTEVYVQVNSEDSRRLGGLVHEEIVDALSVFDADWAGRSDAGVLSVVNEEGENAYGINRYPATPSVLAELAYLSNPSEALVLAAPEYRQRSAEALTRAIVRYLQSSDPGSGFVETPRLFKPSDTTGGTDGCVDPALS